MIDYVAVLADLERKRAALDQVLDGFHQLAEFGAGAHKPIAAQLPALAAGGGIRMPFKCHLGGHDKPKSARRCSVTRRPKSALSKRTGRVRTSVDPARLARGRKLWDEGASVNAVASALGVAWATAKKTAKREAWPKRLSRKRGGQIGPGERICGHCNGRTTTDPCNICGASTRKAS